MKHLTALTIICVFSLCLFCGPWLQAATPTPATSATAPDAQTQHKVVKTTVVTAPPKVVYQNGPIVLGGHVVSTGGNVSVEIRRGPADPGSKIYLFSNAQKNEMSGQFLGLQTDDHKVINLGNIPAGMELIFGIKTRQTFNITEAVYKMGESKRNPDEQLHATVQTGGGLFVYGHNFFDFDKYGRGYPMGSVIIGFEDLYGKNREYNSGTDKTQKINSLNDVILIVTGAVTSPESQMTQRLVPNPGQVQPNPTATKEKTTARAATDPKASSAPEYGSRAVSNTAGQIKPAAANSSPPTVATKRRTLAAAQ